MLFLFLGVLYKNSVSALNEGIIYEKSKKKAAVIKLPLSYL